MDRADGYWARAQPRCKTYPELFKGLNCPTSTHTVHTHHVVPHQPRPLGTGLRRPRAHANGKGVARQERHLECGLRQLLLCCV